jgi:glycosyltransferase involved in cell wall biosynthesis
MDRPLFSIIIPTYNSSNTLENCIKCILCQTCVDFEILIIDGDSTDDTLDIVKSFGDSRIKIYSEKDKGIYDAMNKGIIKANGEWLYFLGSDDTLYNISVLSEIYSIILENPRFEIIYGNVYSSRFGGTYDGEFDDLKILTYNISHQAVFFKKNIFNLTGIFNIKYKSHADWDHNFKWFLSNKIIKSYVNITVANYGDGGFSSLYPDDLFSKDKTLFYLMKVKKRINYNYKLYLLKSLLIDTVKNKRYAYLMHLLIKAPIIIFN